jgi:serine/threonine protein phosphatase PrpC
LHGKRYPTLPTIIPGKKILYVANVGDSEGFLFRKKQHYALTTIHKPTQTFERNRILYIRLFFMISRKEGGAVMFGRLDGSLAVSRAFGDF